MIEVGYHGMNPRFGLRQVFKFREGNPFRPHYTKPLVYVEYHFDGQVLWLKSRTTIEPA